MTHINDLPEGSGAFNIETNYGTEVYNSILDGLGNGLNSQLLSYANIAQMSFAEVSMSLGPISCDGTVSKILLLSGDEAYEQMIPDGFSAKLVIFKFIPAAFLSSFMIKNQSGVDFFHSDNMLTIRPIFE